jgi:hypothetical protein
MLSNARLKANQQNALRGKGPTSDAGRAASSRNALTHGLTAQLATLAAADPDTAQRVADWKGFYAPVGPEETWLVEQMALAAAQMDRCHVAGEAQRARSMARAADCWDDDQVRLAEETGARLARDPAVVSARLRDTVQGCHWLKARWEALERIAMATGTWDDAQRSLAFDLIGVPQELRVADPAIPEGADGLTLAAIARDQIEALAHRASDRLVDPDEFDRQMAEAGLSFDLTPPARLLRRYHAAAFRLFLWARDEFYSVQGQRTPEAAPSPSVAEAPPPEPPPPPAPQPEPESVRESAPAPSAPRGASSPSPRYESYSVDGVTYFPGLSICPPANAPRDRDGRGR